MAGRLRVTTLPAPTTVFSPIVTPGHTIAPPPQPNAIANRHRESVFDARAPALGLQGMCSGVDVDTGCDLYFIANRDAIAVEKDAIKVNERPVPDGDVEAIIAPECRLEYGLLTKPGQQLRQ